MKKKELKELLQFARSVDKRLDEHRELVESIRDNTNLFKTHEWHITHMATQDDYLMRIFYICYEYYPENAPHTNVRKRPDILGACGLPEYETNLTKGKAYICKKFKKCSA